MLPTLIILVLVYLLYRSLRPQRPWFQTWLQKKLQEKFASAAQKNAPRNSKSQTGQVIDEMKACPQCGTYNATQLAYVQKGLYFCNRQCQEAYAQSE